MLIFFLKDINAYVCRYCRMTNIHCPTDINQIQHKPNCPVPKYYKCQILTMNATEDQKNNPIIITTDPDINILLTQLRHPTKEDTTERLSK